MTEVLEIAQAYLNAGLSIIPVKSDGTKAPAISSWKEYQQRTPCLSELQQWFRSGTSGIAVIGGAVSGNLEMIDFDDPAKATPWFEMCRKVGLGKIIHHAPIIKTPTGGFHVYFRCEGIVEGNEKLAFNLVDGKRQIAIETRGEGGYVIAPGSPAACHPSGNPYILRHGDMLSIPVITPEERDKFHACAIAFDTPLPVQEPRKRETNNYQIDGLSPWDDYDIRGDMRGVLEQNGWTFITRSGNKEDWRRPGKTDGVSATIGYCSHDNIPLLYVFSSNAAPFEAEQSYGPFRVYCLLRHNGDGADAARQLLKDGFGDAPEFTRKHQTSRRPAHSWLTSDALQTTV